MTVWELRQYADAVDVGKAGTQGVGMVGADGEFHLAGIVENLFHDFHIAVPSNETLCELITYCSLLDTNYFIITTNHGSNIFACIKKNPRMEDSREKLLKIALSLNGEFDPNKTEINYNDPEGQFEPDKAEIINFNDPEKASKFIKKLLSYI